MAGDARLDDESFGQPRAGRDGALVDLSRSEEMALQLAISACRCGEIKYASCERDPVTGRVSERQLAFAVPGGAPRERLEALLSGGWDGPRIVGSERVADLVMLEIEKREQGKMKCEDLFQ